MKYPVMILALVLCTLNVIDATEVASSSTSSSSSNGSFASSSAIATLVVSNGPEVISIIEIAETSTTGDAKASAEAAVQAIL